MDEQPVEIIRETTRNLFKLSRRFQRNEQSDFKRPLVNFSITSETIEEIANVLKTKSAITISELQTLKNGLLEDPKYIEVVLSTHGALRGLVRELTGKDVQKQCAAAGCICNLGLGDSKAGTSLAKAAGPYLVTALDNLSVELAITCTWALGNVASCGPRAAALLAAHGALAPLARLLASSDPQLAGAALYSLTHLAFQMKDEMSPEHLSKLLEAISKLDINFASAQLLFLMSCHKDFHVEMMPEIYLQRILTDLSISIQSHLKTCLKLCLKDCYLLYLIRVLANVSLNETIYTVFVDSFAENLEEFKALLSKNDVVNHSVLWLFGNLYNFHCDSTFFSELMR